MSGVTLEEALARRRSCRSYDGQPVPAAVLDNVLAAALRGPSAGNTWALDLVVLDTPDAVAGYWDVTLPPRRRESFPWPGLLRAPVLILPVVDADAYVRRYGEPDKAHAGLGEAADDWPVPYWWVDSGAAIMSMLLAATAAGLGSLLFGVFGHEDDVRRHLAVPDDRRIVGAVALGWADTAQRPSLSAGRRRPSVDEITHRGRW